MSGRVRVAGVGAGYFSQFHYDAWTRLPKAELVAVCDRDREKAAAAAARHGIPGIFADAAEMLDAVRPGLLDVVTPPDTHLGLVRLAAARRVAVVCQKPLAPTLAEAEAVVRTAEEAGIVLVVHENFRWQPWYREIRRLLEAGAVGPVHNLAFRLRPGDGQGPDAYLARQPYFQTMPRFLVHETAVHFIDTFRFLLGEIDSVYADLRRRNPVIAGEDAGVVVFGFRQGAVAVFDGNRHLDHAARNLRLTMGEMLVEGPKGAIRLDGDGRIFVRRFGGAEAEHHYAWQDRGFGGDSVHAQQAHVLDHVAGRTPLVNGGRDYLRNYIIEEAVYESYARGCRVGV